MVIRFKLSSAYIIPELEGHISINLSVESRAKVGKPFTSTCDGWEEGTYTNFREWIKGQYGLQSLNSKDEQGLPARQQKAKDITFKKTNGFRVLPPRTGLTVKDMQRVVRAYIGTCYRMCFHEIAPARPLC